MLLGRAAGGQRHDARRQPLALFRLAVAGMKRGGQGSGAPQYAPQRSVAGPIALAARRPWSG